MQYSDESSSADIEAALRESHYPPNLLEERALLVSAAKDLAFITYDSLYDALATNYYCVDTLQLAEEMADLGETNLPVGETASIHDSCPVSGNVRVIYYKQAERLLQALHYVMRNRPHRFFRFRILDVRSSTANWVQLAGLSLVTRSPPWVQPSFDKATFATLSFEEDGKDGLVQSKIHAPLFAARTLNATGQYRVTLSLW